MKREFCADCLSTTTDYTTRTTPDARRFHFCADRAACAERRSKIEQRENTR